MADALADWTALVAARYPERDAASWDATGLQVGDPADPVTLAVVCLDVTEAVLDEAVRMGADLVLAHHPLLFRPLERLTPTTAAGRLALRAARERVGVVAAHTNYDAAESGTTQPIAELLGLRELRPLDPLPPDDVKLVTFVPREDTPGVLSALSAAGAGVIGEYDHCGFRVEGTGTFRPSPAAHPHLGERGAVNEVAEHRLEVVVPRHRLGAAVAALLDAHPYEEVAHDIYPLVPTAGTGKGLGRVGNLPEAARLGDLADRLARTLPSPHLRLAGDPGRLVSRVAACGGAGDSLIDAAVAAGADCYVTGDLRHHPTLDALALGMACIDAGHHATEAAALPQLVARLGVDARDRGLSARLVASHVSTDPWGEYRPPEARSEGP